MKTLERKSGDMEIRSRTSHRIISPWIQNHFLPWPHLWQSVWRHPCRKCHILDGAPPNRLCLKSTARSLWWWPLICPWDFDGNKTQIETINVNICKIALAPKEKATALKSFYPFTILYLKNRSGDAICIPLSYSKWLSWGNFCQSIWLKGVVIKFCRVLARHHLLFCVQV